MLVFIEAPKGSGMTLTAVALAVNNFMKDKKYNMINSNYKTSYYDVYDTNLLKQMLKDRK